VNDQLICGQTFGVFDLGTGQFVQLIQLPVASVDYESLTVGSCGEEDGGNCIYMADVGDGKTMDSQGTMFECSSGQQGNIQFTKSKNPSGRISKMVLSFLNHMSQRYGSTARMHLRQRSLPVVKQSFWIMSDGVVEPLEISISLQSGEDKRVRH
jgi:hypothetical protein